MDDEIKLTIRLPTSVKVWLTAHAKENGRSMNTEIITLLKAAQGDEKKTKTAKQSKTQPA